MKLNWNNNSVFKGWKSIFLFFLGIAFFFAAPSDKANAAGTGSSEAALNAAAVIAWDSPAIMSGSENTVDRSAMRSQSGPQMRNAGRGGRYSPGNVFKSSGAHACGAMNSILLPVSFYSRRKQTSNPNGFYQFFLGSSLAVRAGPRLP